MTFDLYRRRIYNVVCTYIDYPIDRHHEGYDINTHVIYASIVVDGKLYYWFDKFVNNINDDINDDINGRDKHVIKNLVSKKIRLSKALSLLGITTVESIISKRYYYSLSEVMHIKSIESIKDNVQDSLSKLKLTIEPIDYLAYIYMSIRYCNVCIKYFANYYPSISESQRDELIHSEDLLKEILEDAGSYNVILDVLGPEARLLEILSS